MASLLLRRPVLLAATAASALVLAAFALRPIGPDAFAGRRNAVVLADRAGARLGTVLASDTEHAVRVPLAAVSARFLHAVVAVEDRRFFTHAGVDVAALARALVDLVRARRVVSGGSTISMQLARLRFGCGHDVAGKLCEIVLAARIEAGSSKAAILEAYVNALPMGSDLVGVEAAARTYFAVPAADLDWAQAAMLAALPNDPVALDPYLHRGALERRRRTILAALAERGVIDAADERRAATERLALVPRRQGIGPAPHLAFRLARAAAPGETRIPTTIDRNLQRFVTAAVRAVAESLHDRGVAGAAAIVVDNANGDVLAYVGAPDYFDAASLGANDGVVALRQPGSTLKPFLYELAFEERTIRPDTILRDVPTAYALPGARAYAPSDYTGTFAGPVRPRIALADSLNVPAVRTLSALGVEPFLARLRELGFAHLDKPGAYYGLGLTLGSGEVTLEELARAYVAIARGGDAIPLRYRSDAPRVAGARIGRTAEWALVTDMLSDAHARSRAFGVASLLRLPFPAAVKTGTSSDVRDTWTVGFTRDVTVATWAGNYDGTRMQHLSGVTGAAPLWNRIMLHLGELREPGAFAPPAGYARVPICASTGAPPQPGCDAVVAEWLDVRDRARRARAASVPVAPWRIGSPGDGDRYRPGGIVALRTTGDAPAIRWRVNGRPVDGPPRLALARGTYAIQASDGRRRETVVIRVEPASSQPRRGGFTVRP